MKTKLIEILPLLILVFIAVACASFSRNFSRKTETPSPTISGTPEMNSQSNTAPASNSLNGHSGNSLAGNSDTVDGGILNERATYIPQPTYPPAAKAVRASGMVSVQVVVDEKGQVISASATSGHPLLRASAESAAKQARFKPTILSGRAVKTTGVINYNFQL